MITKLNIFYSINENIKQGKQYVQSGKISQSILDDIINIDQTPTKKYVGWISKMYTLEQFNIMDIKSYIEEFNIFVDKGKGDIKDINSFKDLSSFKNYVDVLNQQGTASLKELETDYEVILDNDDVYIASPNTHEASRKLGLTTFAHRDNGKDSAWCTTYKNNNHFYDYFYKKNITFYYVLVKNKDLIKKIGGDHMSKIAFAVLSDGRIDAYDANDTQISQKQIKNITELLGI